MTVLSPRHAWLASVLLLATAIPVWLHAASAPTVDDCHDPAALFQAEAIGGVRVVAPPAPGRIVAVEGRLRAAHHALSVRVGRSFEPWRFYGRPVAFGFDSLHYLEAGTLRWVDAGDEVLPVHWSARDSQSHARVEAYVFVQGGRPVRHPAGAGLGLALPQLLEGTRPVTLLVVSGTAARDRRAELERAAERWLADAWRQLEAACRY